MTLSDGIIMDFYELVKDELELVDNEIKKLVPSEPKEVYEMLLPFIKRGGKRIRPVLILLCCGVVGGNRLKTIKFAVLIEVFHSFTLIHDDICDNSLMRRGLPTINVQYGVPIAINSGDALYTILWQGLNSMELPPEEICKNTKLCADAFLKVVEGQGIELSWYKEGRFDIDEEKYFTMVNGKTAALIALSCELGATIGGGDKKAVSLLGSFGKKLGIAFQIRDDVLNLTGNFDEYKKEIGGDITEGKRTLMVVHALKNAAKKEGDELRRILSKKTRIKTEITRAIGIMNKCGSIDYASKKADEITDSAKKDLESFPESEEKKALLELTDYVTYRRK